MHKSFFSWVLLVLFPLWGMAQKSEIIHLENPSFEGSPRSGMSPSGWEDCGHAGETPPDVQPYGGFNVVKPAQDGSTYLGLVARDNDTWEGVGQRLNKPLKAGTCYNFSMHLARSAKYMSPTKKDQNKIINFDKGITVRIWGGNSYCDRAELLAVSNVVDHTGWKEYKFKFNPKKDYSYIRIEAYYKTPYLFTYNGNILIDNASAISSCDIALEPDPILIAKVDPKKTDEKPKPDPVDPFEEKTPKEDNTTVNSTTKKESKDFSSDLKHSDLEIGETFRLENLYFAADSANINTYSEKELKGLYTFMRNNPSVSIEVGGHTNGLPPHEYCDNLSRKRARNVARYLTNRGISPTRVSYKGYGKREPLATNETKEGRRKNQRVEVKILKL